MRGLTDNERAALHLTGENTGLPTAIIDGFRALAARGCAIIDREAPNDTCACRCGTCVHVHVTITQLGGLAQRLDRAGLMVPNLQPLVRL